MEDLCVLYSAEDVEEFAQYLMQLFRTGSSETEVKFQPIVDVTDTSELSKFKVLILLCSPCMLEFFDDETSTLRFQQCFVNHTCLVCLQYGVQDDEVSCLHSALSIPSGWKWFKNLETKQQCLETIGDIMDILEEQNKLPPKPPPIQKMKKSNRRLVKLMPSTVYKANEEVAVIFRRAPTGTVQVSLPDFDNKILDPKKFSDTTFIFRVPPLPKQGRIRIRVLCNNQVVTDASLKVVKPNLAAFECLDFLAQTLGVDPSDKSALDTKLLNLFDKSIPGDGTLAEMMRLDSQDTPFLNLSESDQEVPTLLHFAAKHGLEDLACAIMDTPGSSAAFQIENKDGLDPADLAAINGYEELSEHMRTQFETHTMVEYIHLAIDNLYLNQEELSRERKDREPERSQSLKLHSREERVIPEPKSVTLPRKALPPEPVPEKQEKEKAAALHPAEFMGFKNKPEPKTTFGSTTHDELIEIMNAVKEGEFTVEEAERLYESWSDRTKAKTSKSLKERQEAINKLRNDYQTVFKTPEKKERQSIFAKIKKKVSPQKKVKDEETYSMHIVHPSYATQDTLIYSRQRDSTVSTISSSSSSSGGSRGSTFSQESWRDSGHIGSVQEESDDSQEEDIDSTPVYDVQRRSSDTSSSSSKRENRISLRDQFLEQMQKNVEASPDLPPRPPNRERPLPGTPGQERKLPVPAQRMNPSIANRPPLPLPPEAAKGPNTRKPPPALPRETTPDQDGSPKPTTRRPPPKPKKKV